MLSSFRKHLVDFFLPLVFISVIVGGIFITFGWYSGDQSLEAVFAVVSLLFGLIAPLFLYSSKLGWLSGMSKARIRRLLFYTSTMVGVGVTVFALFVGLSTDLTIPEFWHSALLNLGTEILGAAFVFLLLEGIWDELSKRASDSVNEDAVIEEIKGLKQEIILLKELLNERLGSDTIAGTLNDNNIFEELDIVEHEIIDEADELNSQQDHP